MEKSPRPFYTDNIQKRRKEAFAWAKAMVTAMEYQIILHSELGPRPGLLILPEGPGAGQAQARLLGCRSVLRAVWLSPDRCRLTGALSSIMGPIPFEAELPLASEPFSCIAHTGKGDIPLTGAKLEREETKQL